jgi:phospholipid/cholesterol/gamma-HCH transport system substrate-binding protein
MRNTLETRLGLFVALAALASVIILELVGGTEMFQRGTHLKAQFNSVQDLKIGDRVKMAGVAIGKVQDIELTNNRALVTMKVKPGQVKTDSIATIKFTGLMGQNFVAITFGSPSAPPADESTLLGTTEQPDLSAMMAKIDNVASGVENLTRSFTGFKIDKLIGPFVDFMEANKGPLTATISNFQAVSSQIASGQGTVGKLIYDDALYSSALTTMSNAQDTVSEIKVAVADARKVLDQVNSGQGTVGKLVKDDALYRELTVSATNLRQILEKVNRGQGSVGKLVNDDELIKNAKLTLQKLDQATEGLEDQGPLSVLGIAISKLF